MSDEDKGLGIKRKVADAMSAIDTNHEKIADKADTVAKATKVAAAVAGAGASIAAPTGITAIGVSLGVVSAPVIVTAAPILIGVAGAALTVSCGASLYSKYKNKKKAKGEQDESN